MNVLTFYLLGFIASFLIQSVFQERFGRYAYWKQNSGWQNEIAIWNIGLSIILYGILKHSIDTIVEIKLALFIMSCLFFINHTYAFFKSKTLPSHIMGALLNLSGMILLCVY